MFTRILFLALKLPDSIDWLAEALLHFQVCAHLLGVLYISHFFRMLPEMKLSSVCCAPARLRMAVLLLSGPFTKSPCPSSSVTCSEGRNLQRWSSLFQYNTFFANRASQVGQKSRLWIVFLTTSIISYCKVYGEVRESRKIQTYCFSWK